MLGFLLVSVAVAVFAAVKDFNDPSVNMLFYWTYAMVAVAILSIVFIGGWIGIKNDKKFLVKVLSVLGGAVVICLAVYFLSPGAPAVGMAQHLTYLTGGVAIVSIIVGEVVKGIRNKRDAK